MMLKNENELFCNQNCIWLYKSVDIKSLGLVSFIKHCMSSESEMVDYFTVKYTAFTCP